MSMQVKRGTTEGWSLGPELMDFSALEVNGADSTIHCEGKTMSMYIGTDSASDFDGDGKKSLGLWLIKKTEKTLEKGKYKVRLSVKRLTPGDHPASDTELYIGDNLLISQPLDGSAEKEITVNSDTDIHCHIRWHSNASVVPVEITLSVREIDGYESLLPGQIGCEYIDDNGNALLKVGPHNSTNEATKWNEIPYIGQILPSSMYVDNVNKLPNSAPVGTIMFVRRT